MNGYVFVFLVIVVYFIGVGLLSLFFKGCKEKEGEK